MYHTKRTRDLARKQKRVQGYNPRFRSPGKAERNERRYGAYSPGNPHSGLDYDGN